MNTTPAFRIRPHALSLLTATALLGCSGAGGPAPGQQATSGLSGPAPIQVSQQTYTKPLAAAREASVAQSTASSPAITDPVTPAPISALPGTPVIVPTADAAGTPASVSASRPSVIAAIPASAATSTGTAASGTPASAALPKASASGLRSGEAAYREACAVCHATGVSDAPRLGDRKAWAPLIAEGQHILTAHGWVGVRAMPPRGGADYLSLEEFARATAYMARAAGGKWRDPDVAMMARIRKEETARRAAIGGLQK